MGRTLIIMGVVLIIIGGVFMLGPPRALFRLPGDFVWRRGALRIYIPLTTTLLISILVSLLLWLFRR